MTAAGLDPNVMLLSKKIGRPRPGRHSSKHGSGRPVYDIVYIERERKIE